MRWEHEDVLEQVQRRLDENQQAMRMRCETVEHPFGTIKARMGATHFLMKRLKNVKTEMPPAVLAHNLTRAMSIIGIRPLIAAIQEVLSLISANCLRTCVCTALAAICRLACTELRQICLRNKPVLMNRP